MSDDFDISTAEEVVREWDGMKDQEDSVRWFLHGEKMSATITAGVKKAKVDQEFLFRILDEYLECEHGTTGDLECLKSNGYMCTPCDEHYTAGKITQEQVDAAGKEHEEK